MKKRADILLFERGFASSRERSKLIILEGLVYIGNKKVNKPSDKFLEFLKIDIKFNPLLYVSRGGLKLEKVIDEFNLNLDKLTTMDIGSSTGGFTECMLNKGAKKVYAIDVGRDQLVEKLRSDPRVIVMEGTNIRNLTKDDITEKMDFISIDVSFISLKLVLPIANEFLNKKGKIVALIKPQFEVGKEGIGKRGIIKDRHLHLETLCSIISFCKELGFGVEGLTFSPITGGKGNIEFLIYLKKDNVGKILSKTYINELLELAHRELN